MKLTDNVILVFKDDKNNEKRLKISIKDLLEKTIDDFYEDLEDECTDSGCNNESQNFCDCGSQYEDYVIHEVLTTK